MFNDTAISANQMQVDDIISKVLPSFLGTPWIIQMQLLHLEANTQRYFKF